MPLEPVPHVGEEPVFTSRPQADSEPASDGNVIENNPSTGQQKQPNAEPKPKPAPQVNPEAVEAEPEDASKPDEQKPTD